MNFIAILVSSIVPLAVGMIWYNKHLFGGVSMKESGVSEEKMKKFNMPLVFTLTFIFSFLMSFVLQGIVIHQFGAMGMIGGNPEATGVLPSFHAFMSDYGTAFRTFRHGALHGAITGLFFALPLIAINAMFECKSWKYIFIHVGYWTLSLTIMGGILCSWVAAA